MTNTLKTLIKVSQQELDGLRRDLNVYLEKKEELLSKKDALEMQLQRENQMFAHMPEAQYTYSNFRLNIGVQQENLDRFMHTIDLQINDLQEKIHEAFQTLKRYDILKDMKEEEVEKEVARKEGIEMDEIGMNNFLWQQQD